MIKGLSSSINSINSNYFSICPPFRLVLTIYTTRIFTFIFTNL